MNTKNPEIVLATPSPVSHRTAEENLGLGYLTSALRKGGYSTHLIDGWLEGLSPSELAERIAVVKNPLFVGFASYRSNMERALATIDILKDSGLNAPTVVGGYGPTFHTKDYLDAGFDYVFRGDADTSLVMLADSLSMGMPHIDSIPGMAYKINEAERYNPVVRQKPDLDTLPFPARDTIDLIKSRKTPVHLLTARGCQAHCTFCSIVAFQKLEGGSQWRARSVDNIVDEMTDLHEQGATFIKVIDDSLVEPPRDAAWCREWADKIQARRLNFILRGSIRADRVTDEVLAELKRAGFVSFSCGVENFAPTALKRMGKTATLDQNITAIDLFKKHGLIMQQGMILFDHGTTLEELELNYDGLRRNDSTVIKGVFTEMYAAEGTSFSRLLEGRGLLADSVPVLGNYRYPIGDVESRKVYVALKAWHKSHAQLYDKTIDPVSAPKAITGDQMGLFMPLIQELRHKDLDFYRKVMDLVYKGLDLEEVPALVKEEYFAQEAWYKQHSENVNDVYKRVGLEYDADENPFLC